MKNFSWLLTAIISWLLFVVSLTTWWVIFSIRVIQQLNASLQNEDLIKKQRMLTLEGGVLIVLLIAGGCGLIYFALREKRHLEEVRHFFSTFSHDLKTSLSRLVLQSERLLQNQAHSEAFKNFQKNLLILEKQLENSLHLAQQDTRGLVFEPVDMKSVLTRLHTQWPDLKFNLKGQGQIWGDRVAIESIFKNLVSNSSLHGKADEIYLQVSAARPYLKVQYSDNGTAVFPLNPEKIGLSQMPSEQGTGLGLFLIKSWMERMKGQIHFMKSARSTLEVDLFFKETEGA